MAIDQGTETVALTIQERTWRVNIETAKGADPVVTVFREKTMSAPDGMVVSRVDAPTVNRALSVVASQTVTIPGTAITITFAQLAATIAATADQWRQADIDAAVKAAR